MRPVKFGVSLPLGTDVAAAARDAERLGFDYVSCGEHISFHEPTANAFVTLAAAAGATRRIGLLSAVTLVPLYPAVLLAKLVAAMDDVSGGRFTLGVGIGGENPAEFASVGVPRRERGARTDEALEVVRRLLSGGPVDFDGRFHRFTAMSIAPRPERGRVPVWVAGRRGAAIRRAARYGDGWMPYLYTPERLAGSVEALRRESVRSRQRPWEGRVGIHLFTCVLPDAAAARRQAVQVVSRTYRQDFGPLADRYLLHGTPGRCRGRLREYRDAGADTFLLRLAVERADVPSMMGRLAAEVVAPLREEGAGQ